MSETPQHKKLYVILRGHILEGVYNEGDLLPSENELCKIYGLTRPTVRQALSVLVNEGYIKKQQGKGSIVNNYPQGIGILSIAGTTSALGDKKLKTKIIVKPRLQNWDDGFMFPLTKIEKELGCIYMERLRLFNDKPIFYDINYIPNINLPRFLARNFENKSLFEVLRKHYLVEIKGGEQRLRAIPASKEISGYLKIAKTKPVLHLERKMETNKPNFVVYSSIYCNTELYPIYGTF